MLSMEQRGLQEFYRYRNGMTNLAYVTGYVTKLSARGGLLLQTRNANQAIPFEMSQRDKVPSTVRVGSIIKILGRIEGSRHPETGEPTGVLRVLRFETPRVLDLPPMEAWQHSLPKGAPAADFQPKIGSQGLQFLSSSNVASVAGIVAGVRLRRAGMVRADGSQENGCLYVLLQQTADSESSVPIRVYGRFSGTEERRIRLGTPVQVKNGSVRIDVKPTGKVLEGGIEEVKTYLYVKAPALYAASRDDIKEMPDWAMALMEKATAKQDASGVKATEAEKAHDAPDAEPSTATVGADAIGSNGEEGLMSVTAALAAVRTGKS